MHTSERLLVAAAAPAPAQTPVVSFAVCVDCGVDIPAWRERLLPLTTATLAVTAQGALALQVEEDGICERCGGGCAEIRVEKR